MPPYYTGYHGRAGRRGFVPGSAVQRQRGCMKIVDFHGNCGVGRVAVRGFDALLLEGLTGGLGPRLRGDDGENVGRG